MDLSRKNPEEALLNNNEFSKFLKRDGELLYVSKDLKPFIKNQDFIRHFKDVIDYRVKRYYKERIENGSDD
ncbi:MULTISPECIES: hypothetical protein [unclassified Caldicellulosiruptor]|uniref:hypothetical protein n=1 Tax=unclassified Caldicellulosiruptor TaxID=2622462 RepID=UPI0003A4524E|nr:MULTISPECIES: hypothetical protein [unclassified Caldicellulosiruptor]